MQIDVDRLREALLTAHWPGPQVERVALGPGSDRRVELSVLVWAPVSPGSTRTYLWLAHSIVRRQVPGVRISVRVIGERPEITGPMATDIVRAGAQGAFRRPAAESASPAA